MSEDSTILVSISLLITHITGYVPSVPKVIIFILLTH
jgi:hypothetical protein